jgi:aminoglycoside phosphotransferase (APT) family kinase protein
VRLDPLVDPDGVRPTADTSPLDRARAAVAEHAPDLRGSWSDLGSGLDHQAFRVGDLVVRVTAPEACAEVTREAGLLRFLAARLSIPVPEPRFADPARGVLAYPLLPGRPLLGRTPPAGAATQLGRMLAELHAVAASAVDHQDRPTDPAAPAEPHGVNPAPVDLPVEAADPRDWLVDLTGPAELLRVLHADRPPTSTEGVLAHADLGAEHLLAADGRLTGVVDWSDAAVTDPALDFARLYRDFGPAFLDEALRAYGRRDAPAFRRRITFFARCAALEDLAYGHPAYTRPAARSLTWLFPATPTPR